jgi:hypothetical protein
VPPDAGPYLFRLCVYFDGLTSTLMPARTTMRRFCTKTSGYSDLRTDPKLIFGLRKPIAIHAKISLNMNLPE